MKESLIQTAIEQYLKILENQNKIIYQKNNSGAVRTQNGGFIRFGKAGAPDFLLWTNGKSIGIEVKNEKGKQTENQKEFQSKFEKLGHYYFIARSVYDVENIIKTLK